MTENRKIASLTPVHEPTPKSRRQGEEIGVGACLSCGSFPQIRYARFLEETLSEIRKKIEKHIKNTYLRRVQAPQGVKPTLKAWMELS
jgi:hypothetical protein